MSNNDNEGGIMGNLNTRNTTDIPEPELPWWHWKSLTDSVYDLPPLKRLNSIDTNYIKLFCLVTCIIIVCVFSALGARQAGLVHPEDENDPINARRRAVDPEGGGELEMQEDGETPEQRKKRGNIIVNKKVEEIELLEKIKKMEIMNKYIKGKKVSKTIYVKGRLINIIIK